ncbi:MAG: ABC transporter substrate-binding protein [Dehalococcoidia bacterium]
MSEHYHPWTHRTLSRRRMLRGAGLGALGLAGAALIGCGGEDETPATPSGGAAATATGPTPAASATQAATPRGGTLKFAYHADPAYLTPRFSRSGFDNAFLLVSGDNYVYVKADGTVDPERGLFPQFEYPDPATFVAKLRPDVKFHDGSVLDAEAVKAHLEYLMDPEKAAKFGYASLLSTISAIDTPDAETVSIKLTTADVGFVSALAVAPGIPFSVAAVDQFGDTEILKPVMTGPYKVDDYTSGAGWTYSRNEAFWGPKEREPYLDKLEFRAITQDETRAAAVESGDVDATWFPSSSETTLRLSKSGDLQSRSFEAGPTLFTVNQNMPPLDNLKLRQAIAHAIDKAKILQADFQGQGAVAQSMLPSGTFGYLAHDPYPYDVAKAKALVLASGEPTPIKIKYALAGTPPSAGATLTASLYKEMLDAVGFDVQIENVTGNNAIFDALFANKTHHVGPFSTGVRPDPVAQFALYATSDAFYNAGRDTADPAQAAIDELVGKARAELNDEAREALLFDIQRLLHDNVFAQIPIVARIRWAFAGKNVGGFDDPEFLNTPAGASFRARLLWLNA